MSNLAVLDPLPATRLSDAEILIGARALGAAALSGARLVAALLRPNLEAHELARRIANEPGIAARVLRVANSAYFGCAGSVGTLDRAIQVLGLAGIKGAAAAACMDRMAPPRAAVACFDSDRFRRHSLACACAAQQVARQLAPDQAEEAFMAGLLHDLGVVVLARLRPQGLAAWLRALDQGLVPWEHRADIERQHLGCTHDHCTGLTLHSWQLPERLVKAVSEHHGERPDAEATPSLRQLLMCGHALAVEAGLGMDVDGPAAGRGPHRAAKALALALGLGLTEDHCHALAARLPDEVAGLMAALAGD